jgi:hypothetical protein
LETNLTSDPHFEIESRLAELMEDSDFLRIDESRQRFNIFDALGGQRAELRHSNFLSFLLSPSRPHGLGSRPLQIFLNAVAQKIPRGERAISILQIAVADLEDSVVHRELDNIDLLIEIHDLNLVVVIENKVGAKAGPQQLTRYRTQVESKYKNRKRIFVFLTPTGTEPDDQSYTPFSYSELATILDSLIREENRATADTSLVLRHYIEMLRRHVVDDEQLRALAIKVYERHAAAFDFILKCRPQAESLLPAAIERVTQNQALVQDHHTPTMYRFAPKEWLDVPDLNKCPKTEWTKSGRNVLFER